MFISYALSFISGRTAMSIVSSFDGDLDSKTAQVFSGPAIYSILKLYPDIPNAHNWIIFVLHW